jgi:signal recognition particle subunit SRP54
MDMDPSKMTPEQIEQIKKLSGGQLPPGFGGGGLPPMPPGLGGGGMPKLPGLGKSGLGNPGLPGPKGGLPGLGFNPFGGKKK